MAAPRALTPAKERKVVEQYGKGKTSAQLAEKFGVHRSTIVGIVKRAGGEVRQAGGIKGVPRQR